MIKVYPFSNFILKGYNDHQKKAIEDQHKLMGNVVYYIKKSMVFPKWSIKLFWGLLTIIFLVLGFSVYKVSSIAQIRQDAYGKGRKKQSPIFGPSSRPARRQLNSTKIGRKTKAKSRK